MRIASLIAAALLAAATHTPLRAERTPPRPVPLDASGGEARVIVKFRDSAATVRAYALSARATPEDAARVLADRAATLGTRHGLLLHAGAALGDRTQVLRADPAHGLDGRALAARLAADPEVEYAEPDRRARRVAVPNDPFFNTVSGPQGPASGQWYLRTPAGEVVSSIDAVRAWDATKGSAEVIVAVLDTGVRPNHPDLAGKLVGGYDMVDDADISNDGNARDSDPSDPGDWLTQTEINANPTLWQGCEASPSSWHGTQVAGIVGATTNNATGMAGAGWNIRVMPVRVLGKCFGYISDIAAGIRWAAGGSVPGVPPNPNPAKVINLSLGSGGACSQTEADAVAEARTRGAVLVAAAGNTAGQAAGSPANCPGAIGVAGLRHVGTKVGFSDVGVELTIAAPGGNCVNVGNNEPCLYPILTTLDSGVQTPGSPTYSDSFNPSVGTSFSSPLVAATAALMFSAQPSLTPDGLRDALRMSARPFPTSGVPDDPITGAIQTCRAPRPSDQSQCYCTTSTCGAGMLDANSAVGAALGLRAAIAVAPAAPQAGQTVTLSADASVAPSGRSIAGRQWTLVDGGGIVGGIPGATSANSVSVTPSAAGSFTVRLTVTDTSGAAVSSLQTITVAAVPVTPPSTGGGGGTMSWAWLLGLALAAWALAARPSTVRSARSRTDLSGS